MAVGDDSGVEPKRWCGVTFEHRPVLVQAHMVPLLYKSPHYLFRDQRKGFELVYIVLNESTWEGRYMRLLYLIDIFGCNSMKIETCMAE